MKKTWVKPINEYEFMVDSDDIFIHIFQDGFSNSSAMRKSYDCALACDAILKAMSKWVLNSLLIVALWYHMAT